MSEKNKVLIPGFRVSEAEVVIIDQELKAKGYNSRSKYVEAMFNAGRKKGPAATETVEKVVFKDKMVEKVVEKRVEVPVGLKLTEQAQKEMEEFMKKHPKFKSIEDLVYQCFKEAKRWNYI